MANPSSSRHDHDDRERRHRSDRHSSSSHHHRTISSTTLLLVLSLILAVLSVVLSLPYYSNSKEDSAQGVWGYLAPKRSQALIARESAVAAREAEVARREAELLVGAPGGVIPSQTACPACPSEPAQTIIKEVIQESALAAPSWFKEAGIRAEEILDRELKIAEREREISKREESVNRREHDASRRESWIMEQLMWVSFDVNLSLAYLLLTFSVLGNDNPQSVEEEYVYEPAGSKRKPKVPPPLPRRSEL